MKIFLNKHCADESKCLSWKKCKCGNNLCIDVGDCIRDGEFEWFASMHCNKCGEAMEMDGRGIFDLPCEIQQEIINQDGEWGLYSQCSELKISFALKKILHEPINNIFEEKNLIFKGTRSQVQWLLFKLMEKGIKKEHLEIKPYILKTI